MAIEQANLDWVFPDVAAGPTTIKRKTTRGDFVVATPVRWAFYAFIATIPFETVDLGIPVEITTISLLVLFLSLVFQLPLVFQKPPAAYWCFALYFIVFASLSIFNQSLNV